MTATQDPSSPVATSFYDLSAALGLLAQLRYLDALWTAAAHQASQVQGSERSTQVSTTTAVVDAVDSAFQELAKLAPRLEELFAKHQDTEGTEAFLSTLSLSGQARARELLTGKGNPAQAAREVVSGLPATATREMTTIRSEVDKLSRGADATGDFSTQTEAQLAALALGVTFIAGPEAGAGVEILAHAGEAIVGLASSIWDWLTS